MDASPHFVSFAEEPDQAYPTPITTDRLRRLLARLDAYEAGYVRIVADKSKHPSLLTIIAFVNSMGNGWLYLPLVILLSFFKGWQSWRFLVAGSLSVIVAHSFYRFIKKRLGRMRPCDFDPTLGSPIKALDQYSCPSGHCMTATAVGVPLVLAFPGTILPVAAIWLMIAWSRISLGHHYPTDLLLGGIIGSVIAVPISLVIL
jgi:undecaprenyl-diphosphatase